MLMHFFGLLTFGEINWIFVQSFIGDSRTICQKFQFDSIKFQIMLDEGDNVDMESPITVKPTQKFILRGEEAILSILHEIFFACTSNMVLGGAK